eukprot:GHVH01004574.1.p1 GENE.GHVH01004574.1~~GHVH01004574.1.p1  ORF type:complete len:989 (+),score=144.83 GHVH01004574.1:105-3071(+)
MPSAMPIAKQWSTSSRWDDMPEFMGGVDNDEFFSTSFHHHPSSVFNDPRVMWSRSMADNRAGKHRSSRKLLDFWDNHSSGEELTSRLDSMMIELDISYERAVANALHLDFTPTLGDLYQGDEVGNPRVKKPITLINQLSDLPLLNKIVSASKYPFVSVCIQVEDRYSFNEFVQLISIATVEHLVVIDPFSMYQETALRVALADVFQDNSICKIFGPPCPNMRNSKPTIHILESEFGLSVVNRVDFGLMVYQRHLRSNTTVEDNTYSTGDGYGLDRFLTSALDVDCPRDCPALAKPSYKTLMEETDPLLNFSERPLTADMYIMVYRVTEYILQTFWTARVVLNQSAFFATRKPASRTETNAPLMSSGGSVLKSFQISMVNDHTMMIGYSAKKPWLWDQKEQERLKKRKSNKAGVAETQFADAFVNLYLLSNDPFEETNKLNADIKLRMLYISHVVPNMQRSYDSVGLELLNMCRFFRDTFAKNHDLNAEWLCNSWELTDILSRAIWATRDPPFHPFSKWKPTEADLEKYHWLQKLVDAPERSVFYSIIAENGLKKTFNSQISIYLQKMIDETWGPRQSMHPRGNQPRDRVPQQTYSGHHPNEAAQPTKRSAQERHEDTRVRDGNVMQPNMIRHLNDPRHSQALVHPKPSDHSHVQQSINKNLLMNDELVWTVHHEDPDHVHTFRDKVPNVVLECLMNRTRASNYIAEDLHKENSAFIPFLKIILRSREGAQLTDLVQMLIQPFKAVSSRLKAEGGNPFDTSLTSLESRVVQWGSYKAPSTNNSLQLSPFVVMSFEDVSSKVYKYMKEEKSNHDVAFLISQAQSPLITDLTRWSQEGMAAMKLKNYPFPGPVTIYFNLAFCDLIPANVKKNDEAIKNELKMLKMDTAIKLRRYSCENDAARARDGERAELKSCLWFYVIVKARDDMIGLYTKQADSQHEKFLISASLGDSTHQYPNRVSSHSSKKYLPGNGASGGNKNLSRLKQDSNIRD